MSLLQERLCKIPQGVHTLGLMSHETRYETLEPILEEGILSLAELYKKYRKIPSGYGSDLQATLGAYNYVSVWDPYCGYGTRPWHKEAADEARKRIRSEFKKEEQRQGRRIFNRAGGAYSESVDFFPPEFTGIEPKITEDGNEVYVIEIVHPDFSKTTRTLYVYKDGRMSICHRWENPNRLWCTLETFLDPRNRELFERVNRILEEIMYREDDKIPSQPILYYGVGVEEPRKINPLNYFASDGAPVLLINPELKRIPTPHSGFGPESFVKDKINTEDIVGLVIPAEFLYKEDGNWIRELVKKHELPLFASKQKLTPKEEQLKSALALIGSAKMYDKGEYKFELIYP